MKLCFSLLAVVWMIGAGSSFSAAAQPAAPAEITGFDQVLADVPRNVLADLRPQSRKLTEAMFQATEQVKKNVKDKMGRFKIRVRNVEKFATVNPPGKVRFRVYAEAEKVRDGGAAFNAFVVSVVDMDQNDKAAKLKKGDNVTVTGKIVSGHVYGVSYPGIEVILVDAKLE
jgi:hypothetical protein